MVSQQTPKGLKDVPVSLFIATLGTDVQLPCHYCNKLSGLSGRIWRRRSLHGVEKEVKLDMHDDRTKNRVFVVKDHSLVIRQVTPSDGAYYFCYDVENATQTSKVDILLDEKIPSVSQYTCYVEWSPWSKCDTCGKLGERKRVGKCRIQKLVKAQVETPQGNVIEADFPIVGVGCHSVLLDDIPEAKRVLNKIPNIVLLEKCQVSCDGFVTKAPRLKAVERSSFLKKIKMSSENMNGALQVVKAEERAEKEGNTIAFFCPGATLDSKIKWKKNGRSMKPEKYKRTSGRIYIDVTDVLHIKSLRLKDGGEYICTQFELEIGLIHLKVISRYTWFDPSSNFGILTISLSLSFILWCILMAVKWKNFMMQRRVQQKKARRYKSRILQDDEYSENLMNNEESSTYETS